MQVLPGRTQNGVKNHWHATMRKVCRAPVYANPSTPLQAYLRELSSGAIHPPPGHGKLQVDPSGEFIRNLGRLHELLIQESLLRPVQHILYTIPSCFLPGLLKARVYVSLVRLVFFTMQFSQLSCGVLLFTPKQTGLHAMASHRDKYS